MEFILPARSLARQRKTAPVVTALLALVAVAGCSGSVPGTSDGSPDLEPPVDADLGGARDLSSADLARPDAGPLPDGGPEAIGVVQGPCHACAWRGGQAFCWGSNDYGELGDGTKTTRSVAAPVLGLASVGTIVQMTVGCGNPIASGHTCALNSTGDLWCWGNDQNGQLGDQTATDQLMPEKILGLPPIAAVSAGAIHTCALATNQHVYCWGNNASLQIGDGTTTNRPAPTLASGITDAVALSAGDFHNCVLRAAGPISCWGANNYGEVGTGDLMGVAAPTDVTNIGDAVQIVSGPFHTCARRGNGTAWCWGAGQYGMLGNGMMPMSQVTPVQVGLSFAPAEIGPVLTTCARDALGSVECWGSMIDATGAVVFNATPVAMASLTDAVLINGNCAVRSTGVISCWGFNAYGQLGDGTTMNRSSPVDVQGIVWQ